MDDLSGAGPRCPACGEGSLRTFFRASGVPVHQNLLIPTLDAALHCVRGDIELAFCQVCGFVSNTAFQPELVQYTAAYENSQAHSPTFRAYLRGLAEDLINRHSLRGRHVLEIGCGKGEFLALLCELGENQGVGFDPSYIERDGAATRGVTVIRDFYSDRYADYHGDLVCCRHVLEHLQDPAGLVRTLRAAIGTRTSVVFFEIPSLSWILDNLTFWDIFYEHCSYFAPVSLARLFASCGFHVDRLVDAAAGQYLWLEARPDGGDQNSASIPGALQTLIRLLEDFPARCREKIEVVRREVHRLTRSGRPCVVWGAGAKGVTYLNALDITPQMVPYVVDVNPRKQGMYVPGTGQRIVPPEFLRQFKPEVVLVMNPLYLGEIRHLVSAMGLGSEVVSL